MKSTIRIAIIYCYSFLPVMIMTFFLVGCTGHQRTDLDTSNSGKINISVDESFKPVIDSQIQVFEALFPKAKINVVYKPEAACLKDLQSDSTRMIIVTRGLTDAEEKFYKDSFKFVPASDKVANDAIAIIVNNKAKDTTFTLSKIRGILSGSTGDKQIAVFDGLTETSSIRYAIDSILRGKAFDPKKVFAVKSSQDVIDYVSGNIDAIGFVGVSWIGNKEDTAQLSFLRKVKISAIECTCPENTFVKPYQANIVTRRYPLVRGLYYIVKENYEGLGGGFANFLTYEKGQKIFYRAYLAPARMDLTVRSATMN